MFNQSSKQILVGIFVELLLLAMSAYAVENVKVSNYGGSHQIWFEVEDFDERDPDDDSSFGLVEEPDAFGRAIRSNSDNASARISWTFDISKADGMGGTWYFWGRVINPGNNSDYMLVTGDDTIPGKPYPGGNNAHPSFTNDTRVFEQNEGPPWTWTNPNHEEAHTKTLQDGVNTMYIYNRDYGALWDAFMWTDDPDYVPTDVDYEGAVAPSLATASSPSPTDGATDVPLDVVLSWTPGEHAPAVNGHRVFLGEVFSDVNDGIGAVTLSAASYAPPQRLDFETTYYWCVDEVNDAPDFTVFKGDVWSFTTEPVAYPIANVTATASSSAPNQGPPSATVDGSGMTGDLHSTAGETMWLSGFGGPQPSWILFEFDKLHPLHEMWVWNSNSELERSVGFGFRDVTIEYSVNGADYTTLGTTHEFAQAPGTDGYAHNTTVDFGGLEARCVRLTANSGWAGFLPQFSLSEVRFLSIPVSAREPSPDPGAADVDVDVTLAWRAGREAAVHNVYVSADEQAVIDGTAPITVVTEASHSPSPLDLGSAYYWRVDEVNESAIPSIWQGDVWSFTTADSVTVDDFESYNNIDPPDPASHTIFEVWIDGFADSTRNGALAGNDFPPYCETRPAYVHGDDKAMPFYYNNSLKFSEATMTFAGEQDWTKHGVGELSLWFRGETTNAVERMYVTLNGTGAVPHDSPNAAQVDAYEEWIIPLQKFVDQGVDLANVTSITIGLGTSGNTATPGGTGKMYFDDILLYPPRNAP